MPELRRVTQYRIIEEAAENLSSGFSPPIPIEKIAEVKLGLSIEIVNLSRFGRKTLGVLLPKERRILLSQHQSQNQYLFTIAHEIGHWVLHAFGSKYETFLDSSETLAAYYKVNNRSKKGRKNKAAFLTKVLEIEANRFASALLVPRAQIIRLVNGADLIDEKVVANLATMFNASMLNVIYRIGYLIENQEPIYSDIDKHSLLNLELSIKSGFKS